MDTNWLLFPKSSFNGFLASTISLLHTFCFCTEKKLQTITITTYLIPKESALFNSANVFLFLSSTDQIVPSIWSLNCSPTSDLPDHIERYSRKVFVGGLPPDIDEGTVTERVYILAP